MNVKTCAHEPQLTAMSPYINAKVIEVNVHLYFSNGKIFMIENWSVLTILANNTVVNNCLQLTILKIIKTRFNHFYNNI